jgi:hypothetical protein
MPIKPILFSTPMVQAILDGRKTQTRRFVQANSDVLESLEQWETSALLKRKYDVGDILWVRETIIANQDDEAIFKADGSLVMLNDRPRLHDSVSIRYFTDRGRKVSSIHMPKEACRIFLRVFNVSVERVQDISDHDAICEGIAKVERGLTMYYDYLLQEYIFTFPKRSFESLWSSINGPEFWNDNPWVWKIEFERVSMPDDFLTPF